MHRLAPKNRTTATVLTAIFGPFGLLYVHTRMAILAIVADVAIHVGAWLWFGEIPIVLAVLNIGLWAWVGYTTCVARNAASATPSRDVQQLHQSFGTAALAMTSWLPIFAATYIAAVPLLKGVAGISNGRIGAGVGLLIASPIIWRISVWAAGAVIVPVLALCVFAISPTARQVMRVEDEESDLSPEHTSSLE